MLLQKKILKNSTKLKHIAVLLALFSSQFGQAQNLLVNLNNGATETFPISTIKSIKFSTNTMILNLENESIVNYAIPFINNYTFDELTSSGEILTSSSTLKIYPNPALDYVNIVQYLFMPTGVSDSYTLNIVNDSTIEVGLITYTR